MGGGIKTEMFKVWILFSLLICNSLDCGKAIGREKEIKLLQSLGIKLVPMYCSIIKQVFSVIQWPLGSHCAGHKHEFP